MALSFNGVRYYYVTSLQGDITAIVDQTGTVVTTYLYDAWGNHLHITGSLSATVGRYNPLRYRGYVYDRETKLYYLQSRYYNPETGRFINGDGYVATGLDVLDNNMYTYCYNNPVMYPDPSGQIGIIGGIIGGGVVVFFLLLIPSSEEQEPTESQRKAAKDAADRAILKPATDGYGNKTIDIQIDTKDVLDNVDSIAMSEFYDRLYDRMLEKAHDDQIPTDNLMSHWHICWEFVVHKIGYHFGIENTITTDLNVDESPWTMFLRLFG